MAYIFYNPNPVAANVADCSVRAISKALDLNWDEAYIKLTINGLQMGDLISSDNVWGSVLRQNGFTKAIIPNTCPDCYYADEFCKDFPNGVYVLGFGGHVATVVDGDLYDSWDCSHMVPIYYWHKEENNEQPISTAERQSGSADPSTAAGATSK